MVAAEHEREIGLSLYSHGRDGRNSSWGVYEEADGVTDGIPRWSTIPIFSIDKWRQAAGRRKMEGGSNKPGVQRQPEKNGTESYEVL